jgi:hypothetical protein
MEQLQSLAQMVAQLQKKKPATYDGCRLYFFGAAGRN